MSIKTNYNKLERWMKKKIIRTTKKQKMVKLNVMALNLTDNFLITNVLSVAKEFVVLNDNSM